MADTLLTPEEAIACWTHLIASLGHATPMVGGRIGFLVHGKAGGAWVVDLDVPGGAWKRVMPADVPACDTTVYSFANVFGSILLAPEGIEDLLETGEVVVEGDRTKLQKLARLVAAGGSPLQQRSRTRAP